MNIIQKLLKKFSNNSAKRIAIYNQRLNNMPAEFKPSVDNRSVGHADIWLDLNKPSPWFVGEEKWLNLDK